MEKLKNTAIVIIAVGGLSAYGNAARYRTLSGAGTSVTGDLTKEKDINLGKPVWQ